MQILSVPVVKEGADETPIITFFKPVVTAFPALAPTAVLFPSAPVVMLAIFNAS